MSSENFDSLLNELSSFSFPVPSITDNKQHKQSVEITEENINDYIFKKTGSLIDAGLGAVEDLKDFIVQGQNPDEIAALSELISSTTKAIEALNRINLLNKKAKTDKELKTLELQNKKEIAGMLPGNNITNNTNVLIASREEIIKQLIDTDIDTQVEVIENIVIEEKEDK
jgi:hypothetical protein